jgi:hypothetical protein
MNEYIKNDRAIRPAQEMQQQQALVLSQRKSYSVAAQALSL